MSTNEKQPSVLAKRSYRDGCVSLSVNLRSKGWLGSDTATIKASTELSSPQARELARSLVELADQADAKVAAKVAADERRRKYRDREIAAGRMVVLGRLS